MFEREAVGSYGGDDGLANDPNIVTEMFAVIWTRLVFFQNEWIAGFRPAQTGTRRLERIAQRTTVVNQ